MCYVVLKLNQFYKILLHNFGGRFQCQFRQKQSEEEIALGGTFFKKAEHRKWPWMNPDFRTKNEIDFIITNKKTIITDVTVLNKVSVESYHRIVTAKISLNLRSEQI